MAKKLFPKNFLTIQVPPTIQVKERRDGALVIHPPTRGDVASTMQVMDTAAGTVSTSTTRTNQGTSTEGQTWTRTQKIATVLKSGKKTFPVTAAGFASVSPTSGRPPKPDLSKDSFQLAEPIPTSESASDARTHLTGEPKLVDFNIKNVVVPPLEESARSFTFPDVGPAPPWEGGVATQFDPDEDNPGDTDNDPDSDDDDDSDDGSDQGNNADTTDFPGGFSDLQKHIHVTPPLAPKGTKGKLRRR
jgi:hypothetical protein